MNKRKTTIIAIMLAMMTSLPSMSQASPEVEIGGGSRVLEALQRSEVGGDFRGVERDSGARARVIEREFPRGDAARARMQVDPFKDGDSFMRVRDNVRQMDAYFDKHLKDVENDFRAADIKDFGLRPDAEIKADLIRKSELAPVDKNGLKLDGKVDSEAKAGDGNPAAGGIQALDNALETSHDQKAKGKNKKPGTSEDDEDENKTQNPVADAGSGSGVAPDSIKDPGKAGGTIGLNSEGESMPDAIVAPDTGMDKRDDKGVEVDSSTAVSDKVEIEAPSIGGNFITDAPGSKVVDRIEIRDPALTPDKVVVDEGKVFDAPTDSVKDFGGEAPSIGGSFDFNIQDNGSGYDFAPFGNNIYDEPVVVDPSMDRKMEKLPDGHGFHIGPAIDPAMMPDGKNDHGSGFPEVSAEPPRVDRNMMPEGRIRDDSMTPPSIGFGD